MSRVYNFSAGPSQMSEKVLAKAAEQMLDYKGTGQSVMEMSHRSKEYGAIINSCRDALRSLMNIPDNYQILFLQGGASTQFGMIPMNLMTKHKKMAVIDTGAWSNKALKEAKKIGEVEVVASSKESTYSYIPKEYTIPEDIDYFYICENNTIYGTKYHQLPDVGNIPLVSDISSCILSEPVDVTKYAMLFAGAQKNLGMAGLTVVIIRDDLLVENKDELISMFSYKVHADNESMFNTPPAYAIYVLGLILDWIKEEFGTVENLHEYNKKKAAILYDYLDQSKLFKPCAAKEDRSLMNVTFVTGDADLDKEFIAGCTERGMINIKGHRSVGGMRASLYNAMKIEGVEKLVAYMKEFEEQHV